LKRRKVGNIGIVIGDDTIRAAQLVDGRLLFTSVPIGDNAKKSLRQLVSSAPFIGRNVMVGLEGRAVLIESIVLPPGTARDARKVCTDRLKGDPLFSADKAVLGVAVETMGGDAAGGQALAIMAAMNKERLVEMMKACRESELNVQGVESAALAAWRAWPGKGLQVRLVRSAGHDMVLAGNDEKLLFCRIVDAPVLPAELRATIGRAASLLGTESFSHVTIAGIDEVGRAEIASGLDIDVHVPAQNIEDAAAAGMAAEGVPLADFTPPEERVLREKRRVRKVGMAMAAGCGVLLLAAGVLGGQHISSLKDRKASLEQQRDVIKADRQQLDELNTRLAREEANEAVITMARPGHRMSTLFALISQKANKAISLETIKLEDKEDMPPPGYTGPLGRRVEARLNGLASSGLAVRQFADALLATGAFADVRVEASERVLLAGGTDGERFRIYARAETH